MENPPESRQLTLVEEAADPGTNAERLRQLSGYRGVVARAVAANPNTPTYLLIWLAKRYCAEVLRNSVFPLLMLEDPGLPLKLPVNALRGILRDWEPPGEFLHTLQRHPDSEIREAARLHVANHSAGVEEDYVPHLELKGGAALAEMIEMGAAPPWLLGAALESNEHKLRKRALVVICKGPDKTLHSRVKLLRAAGAGGWLNALGKGDPSITPEGLAALATGGPYARKLAAHNSSTPPEVLETLGRSLDPKLLRIVARNRATPISTLLSFALGRDKSLRRIVARNKNLLPNTLDQLSVDPDAEIRLAVAANSSTPPASLARLAADPSAKLRQRVAANASTDMATLQRLMIDSQDDVREAVAKRRGCPVDILHTLAKEDSYVGFCATHNGSMPKGAKYLWRRRRRGGATEVEDNKTEAQHAAEEEELDRCYKITRSKEVTAVQLAELSMHANATVRSNVAYNAQTPVEILTRLAADPEQGVRNTVAQSPRATPEILRRLAEDEVLSIRSSALGNPNVPDDLLERHLSDEAEEIRAAIAGNTRLADAWLLQIARDEPSEKVHYAILHRKDALRTDEAMAILAGRCEKCLKEVQNPVIIAIGPKVMEVATREMTPHARRQFISWNQYQYRYRSFENPIPIPPEILQRLMTGVPDDKYLIWTHWIMKDIAGYWAVTPDVLESMANNLQAEKLRNYRRVNGRIVTALAAIARNKNTPVHVLEQLLQHTVPSVRLAALGNPFTPADATHARLGITLEMAGASASLGTRLCALSHPQTAPATLRQAAWNGRWAERYAITQNPAAPRDVLAALTEDSNRAVSQAARAAFRARFPDAFLNQIHDT